jgi:hypothetical protein
METIIIEKDRFKARVSVWDNYFSGLEWVIKARSKDDTRPNIQTLCSKDGFLCCTDGSRLHLFEPDNENLPPAFIIPDGLWEVQTATTKQIILVKSNLHLEDYPDFWRVLSYRAHNGISPLVISYGRDKKHIASLTILAYHISVSTHKMIRYDFIQDALFEGRLTFQTDGNDLGPLFFGNERQLAVLCPLKQ